MNGPLSKAARAILDLTRFEVATKVGFSPEVLRNYENGVTMLSPEYLDVLNKFYSDNGVTFEVSTGDNIYKISMVFKGSL